MPQPDLVPDVGVLRVHPHGRALALPLLVLLLGLGLAGYGAAALPADAVALRLAGLVLLGAALVRFSVVPWVRWLGTQLVVGPDGVEHRTGLLRRRRRVVPLDDVVAVHVERSAGDRLLGSGTLVVEPAGTVSPLVVRTVPRVRLVAEHLADLLDERPFGR